ncbi:MAG: PEGA domain-containing protein [Fibromonadaceae bacterium]|jgi:hypothetical protein|nr:PEGA domain-containing protein [Fibromonadaceae bacterium]
MNIYINRAIFFLATFALSSVFAQQGAPVALPTTPLNLAELSAKDTASFETYSKRIALVQDSIVAMQAEIEGVKQKASSSMPALEPKGEYEKQVDFDARKAKWEKELSEKTQRDIKVFADRLAELEKTKKKIEENQASLYCFVEIKSNPAAAAVSVNGTALGATPLEYNNFLPGYMVIKIQKENFEPWDTTLTLQAGQKLKLNVALAEASIFSKEEELDFPQILAKDTTTQGYYNRIKRVKARGEQIDGEREIIFDKYIKSRPVLPPKQPGETARDYERKQYLLRADSVKYVERLNQKHGAYKEKLARTIKVLENYIIESESLIITEAPSSPLVALGAYDADKEFFDIEVFDTTSVQSPFYFVGKVGIPLDTAKVMNRSLEGFLISISYLNYPFVFGDSSFNLAMKELILSRREVPLKVDGAFKPIARFEAKEGYAAWRAHADSLLNGTLKPQSLDVNYALSVKEGAAGGGLGWRGWTRILTFAAAASSTTLAVMSHLNVVKYTDRFNNISKTRPSGVSKEEYTIWYTNNHESMQRNLDTVRDNETSRNISSVAAGVFAVAGILTFVF